MANPRLRKELLETVRGLHTAGAIDFKKLQEFETFRVVRDCQAAVASKITFRRAMK